MTTTRELLAAGLSDRRIRTLDRCGDLYQVGHGVYADGPEARDMLKLRARRNSFGGAVTTFVGLRVTTPARTVVDLARTLEFRAGDEPGCVRAGLAAAAGGQGRGLLNVGRRRRRQNQAGWLVGGEAFTLCRDLRQRGPRGFWSTA